jgi:hypothetical protein
MTTLITDVFSYDNIKVKYTIKLQDNKVIAVYCEEPDYTYSVDKNSTLFEYYEGKYNK